MILSLFPLWALLASLLAFTNPAWFEPLVAFIVPMLGTVMFLMGLTLLPRDFSRVFQRPLVILVGVLLQFTVMPLFAWLLGALLDLPLYLVVGMVLVGACPGGTASNVVCYLAKGDVAVSITLTAVSTLLAVVMSPLLTWLWIGERVSVPVYSMLFSVAQIVLVPVLAGLLLRSWLPRLVERTLFVCPYIAMLSIVVIIAAIIAANAEQLTEIVSLVAIAVIAHNILGLIAGYLVPRLLGWDTVLCRTLSIEVGMQNSGLGVALAHQYFSAAAALPGALFSVWHNISGSLLATFWSKYAVKIPDR
jgi:BASS family bile acid:Na+ symporter